MKEYIVQAIAQETIDSFDAHNAPELVRCKDCKWAWNINPTEEEKFYVCKNPTMVNMRYSHQGDWFCANGEVKQDA